MTLRPYQQRAVDDTIAYWRSGKHNPLIKLPTAAGKTRVIAALASYMATRGGRVLVTAHRAELVRQSADALRAALPDSVKVGIWAASLKRREVEQVTVASRDSIANHVRLLGRVDLVVIDECFVAGTKISTPRGPVDIDKVRCGDLVFSARGIGVVEAVSCRRATTTFRVELDDGTELECTGNHPFLTERGWVKAEELEIGARLFRIEDVSRMWERVSSLDQEGRNGQGHCGDGGAELEQAGVLLGKVCEEITPDSAQRSRTQADAGDHEEDPSSAYRAWRQRAVAAFAAARTAARAWGGVGRGACDHDGRGASERSLPKRLQGGHRLPGKNDLHRVGRRQSQQRRAQGAGPEKRSVFGGPRVERVSRVEREGPVTVFNLQVGGHPSYFANGVAVHNCHLVSPKEQTRYAKILAEVREGRPGAQVLGLTATPYRLDQGYLTQGEGALFSSLSCSVSERELLDEGYLTPVVTGDAHATIDTTALGVRAGEFVAADLELAADIDEVTQAVASDVRAALDAGRKSALVYGVSIAHCLHLQDALRSQGINAHVVTGDTEPEFRRQILEDFKARKVQCIVSMDVLTTGFDAPVVDIVAIVRPTMSTSLYVQIVGRGMRLLDGAIGNLPTVADRLEAIARTKPSCLLLDYGGNIARHGPIDDVRVKDKKAKKGEGEAPTKLCPKCYREQPAGVRECEACGYQFPPPEKKANKTASRLPVIGGFATRHDHPLITYREHRKDGRPPMLRVDYDRSDGTRIASEFVDIEDTGLSGEQAWRWWSQRVGGEPYATTAECLAHLHKHGARKVLWVETKPDTKGKWEKVTHVKLG